MFGKFWKKPEQPAIVQEKREFLIAFVKPPIVYCPLCNYEMRPIHKTLGDHNDVECVTNNCAHKGKVFSVQLQTIKIQEKK